MSRYTSNLYWVFRDGEAVEVFHSQKHAAEIATLFNEETAPLLDAIATKDAVIEAQSQRIKELEGVLKQIDSICSDGTNTRIPKIELLIMALGLEESEVDNG